MRHKVKFSLSIVNSVARVYKDRVHRVYALEVHIDLREGRNLGACRALVHSLRGQVECIKWDVKSLLGNYLVKGSVYLLLKHNHVSINFKLCDSVLSG